MTTFSERSKLFVNLELLILQRDRKVSLRMTCSTSGSGRLTQALAIHSRPSVSPLLLIFGLAAAIAVVLIGVCLLSTRLLLRHSGKRNLIRVRPLGVFLGITQFLIAFAIITWGRIHAESLLGQLVASDLGAVFIIVAASVMGCLLSVFLQRRGIVLYYRVKSGG